MTIKHEVLRTDAATYVYLPAETPGGTGYRACVGWTRRTVADPSRWEVRIPTLGGVGDWTAVDALPTRRAAERRLSQLTGRTL